MKIVIDGCPVAQTRMRFSGRNGIGRVYDPRQKEKRSIKEFISVDFSNRDLFNHPRVSFVFHMPIPKSIPRRLASIYESGFLKHDKKPDTDNFIKLYLDCMDGILFDGDQKVSLGACVKLYHPHPKTIILINETTPILSPLEVDSATFLLLYGQESSKQSFSEMADLPGFCSPTPLELSKCLDMTILPRQNVPSDLSLFALQRWEQACLASSQLLFRP